MIKDLTVGKTQTVLWRFTIPMFVSVIFQQMYNIADSMIAGKFAGEDALAAIGASYPITMIFMAIAIGSNIGCSVIISNLFGGKQYRQEKTAIYTTIISTVVLSFILTVVGIAASRLMLRLVQTPENIFEDGALYLRIYIGGFMFLFLYNVVTGIFTSLGDSRTPLYFLIGSSLGNIFLDLLFVIRFNGGVAGVAWATFMAQGIACILSLIVVARRIK
jgi:Na+-driven multidrug efflux pump